MCPGVNSINTGDEKSATATKRRFEKPNPFLSAPVMGFSFKTFSYTKKKTKLKLERIYFNDLAFQFSEKKSRRLIPGEFRFRWTGLGGPVRGFLAVSGQKNSRV